MNLGYALREERQVNNLEIGDALTWGLAGEVPLGADWLRGLVEVYGEAPLANATLDAEEIPAELLVALRAEVLDGLVLTAGGGTGISSGIGSPVARALFSIGYSHLADDDEFVEPPVDLDPDKDGLIGEADACPNQPEDFDGIDDADGCPDEDRDRDSDGDGVVDARDNCPQEAEDPDGYEDTDGCPELDNDGDGIADVQDTCPLKAEDPDGYEDTDGCPELDNDGDGIADAQDACPLQPETFNVYKDQDGCPDVPPEGEIKLNTPVYFANKSSDIDAEGSRAVQKISAKIKADEDYSRVIVEGHADERGEREFNEKLSEERARAVRDALVGLGIPKDKIWVKGFGEAQPVTEGANDEAHRKNRRVEIRVIRDLAP